MKKDTRTQTVEVNQLSWYGNMETVKMKIEPIPLEALRVDDWYAPTIGELCLIDGKLEIVKAISFRPSDQHFKAMNMYEIEGSEKRYSNGMVTRVEVNPDRVFIFRDRVFRHQEALDGGYIDKIAKGIPITEYEYNQFDIH